MKRLYKSTRDRKVMGVCGGLGEYLGVDPTLLRLVWFVLIWIGWGTPLLIYLALGIILPSDYTVANGRANRSSYREQERDRYRQQANRAREELNDFLRRYQEGAAGRSAKTETKRRDVTPKDDWSDF